MTIEEAEKIIEKTESDYKGQKNRIARGLMLLAKYDDRIDSSIGFEHDAIFASQFENTVTKMTPEEVREMALMGWFVDEEQECWTHY